METRRISLRVVLTLLLLLYAVVIRILFVAVRTFAVELESVVPPRESRQMIRIKQNNTFDETTSDFSSQQNNSNYLSACILIMDENPRLPEWLAYHYFALRLRYLVVGIDPRSVETPTPIFDRWRHLTDDMAIIEWNEAAYFHGGTLKRQINWTSFQYLEKQYELRQREFIRKCTRHMKQQNKTFVAYHDVDEYLAINEQQTPNVERLADVKDCVWDILRGLDHHNAIRGNYFVSKHPNGNGCYLFARRWFPPKPSPPHIVQSNVPREINASKFETLRWRFHTNSHGLDIPGKTILDVSRISMTAIDSSATNPHEVLHSVCQNGFSYYTKVLGYHHYAGSRELFFRKNDSRAERMEELWLRRSNISAPVETDEIRPWLQGFATLMGAEKAESLLVDAGDLEFKFPAK